MSNSNCVNSCGFRAGRGMSVGRTNIFVFVGTLGLGLNEEGGLGIMSNVVDGSGDPVDGREELVDGRGDSESTSGGGNSEECVVDVVATALDDGTVVVIILALVEVEDVNLVVANRVE